MPPSSRYAAPPPVSAAQGSPVSPAQRTNPFPPGSPISLLPGYRSRPISRGDGQDALESPQQAYLPALVPIPDGPAGEGTLAASPMTSPTLMSRSPVSPRPGYATAPNSYGAAVGRQPASAATRTPWPSSGQPSPSGIHAHHFPNGYISREPSLPSLMSYPVSRAESPAVEGSGGLPQPQIGPGGSATPVSSRRRESTRSSYLSTSSSNPQWGDIAEETENTLGTTPPSLPRPSSSSHPYVPFPGSRYSTVSSARSRASSVTSSVYLPSHLQGDAASLASPASRVTDISNFGRAQNRRRMSRSQATSIADGTEYYTRVRDDQEGRGLSRAPSPSASLMSPTPGVEGKEGFDWRRSSFGAMRREPRDSEIDGDSIYQQSMDGHDSVISVGESFHGRPGSRASTKDLSRLDTRLSVPSSIAPGVTIQAPSPRRALPQREHFSSPPSTAMWQHTSPRTSEASLGSRLSHYWEQKRSSSPSHYRMWMDDIDGGGSLFEVEVKEDAEGELEAERAATDSGHGHPGDETLKPPIEIDGVSLRRSYSPDEPFDDESMRATMILPAHLQPEAQQYMEESPDLEVRPFRPGDRLAVEGYHDGSEVRDFAEFADLQRAERFAAEQMGEGREIELGRVLGIGTYAVVYHAREIVRDAPTGGSALDVQYGTDFALKCLSKANLSEDMLQVQRFEVTLHRSLPAHENIVQLIRAYETDKWLFLLMDYCPGQDLFYWLHERAIAAAGAIQSNDLYSQATPPSPTLLSSTAQTELLSAPRLKLISRMFMQMCGAVAAAHEVGISHRDIKPENFIVHGDGAEGVMVKLTDWGLGSADELCGDFDTGSKPYMAFECHNNLMPSYDPKLADVWSLGICLINMLFHRSPWMEPALENPEFSAFSEAPVAFLMTRFEGMSRTVANYLADRVLCDVSDATATRASAKQFELWASGLVNHMGGGVKRGSYAQDTIPLEATVSRPSVTIDRNLTDVFHVSFSAADHGMFEPDKPPRPTFAKKDLLISTNLDYSIGSRSFQPMSPIEQQSPTTAMPEPTSATPVDDYRDYPSWQEPSDHFEVNGNPSSISLPEDVGKNKRRKRGARKKRTGAGEAYDMPPPLPSPRTPIPEPERDEVLLGMAVHVQDYGREVSAVTRKASRDQLVPESPGKSPKKTGWRGRMMSLVKDGNPDLQAFKAAVQQRDEEIGATSAPAKMQKGSKMTESGISSYSSVGTASWGSWATTEPEETGPRGAKASHWSSASNRRARLDKKRGGVEEFSPTSSSSRYGTASNSTVGSVFSRSSRSPISSFSSVASADVGGTVPPVPPLPHAKKKAPSPLVATGRAPVGNDAPSWRVIPPPDTPRALEFERSGAPGGSNLNNSSFYAKRDAAGSTSSLRSLKRSKTAEAWSTDVRPNSGGSGDSTPKQPNMISRMLESIKGHSRSPDPTRH